MADKKKCFVVMGFGQKTDYRTSRVLDLDKTYKHIIKPAVEGAGLECIRADEIRHSGTIDVPMYEELMDADLVVCDLSTSNVNAAYELGVRHALRPRTTLIIAESQFEYPFDVSHITIRTYHHDGKALDIDEALRFRTELQAAIEDVMASDRTDSPVYTFLKPLTPPSAGVARAAHAAAEAMKLAATENPTLAGLMDQAQAAKRTAKTPADFMKAKTFLQAASAMAPNDHYLMQQLALVTYKSKYPDEAHALDEAQAILRGLDPMGSNDAETLGLWGAIHKRRWDLAHDRQALDGAIEAYEKGYQLLNDYYNGINYAYLLNVRAAISAPADAITDFVLAQRVRRNVIDLCDRALVRVGTKIGTEDERYWILATKAEALFGLDRRDEAQQLLEVARPLAPDWMLTSTREQLGKLGDLLADPPLKHITS